jgi:hypothetical protein
MTDGGDRDKFEFAKVDNTQVMTNPCLATCADGDLGGGGEDCSACDCEDDPPPTWYSVTFGEPTCEGLVGVTVNPLTDPLRSCAEGQCGPLNGKFKYFFTTNEDNDSPCSPWPGAPDGDLPEVECGDTFFIPIPPPSYITVEGEVEIVPQTLWVFAVDDCGCYVIGCAQFPAYICPLDIDYGDAHDNDIGFEMLDNCFQAAEQCVATFPGMFVGGTYGSIGYTTIYPGCEGATVELLEYNLIEGHTGSGGGQNLVGWCDAMEEPMIWTNEDGSITVYRCGEFYSDVIDPFADPVQEESSNTDYYVALVIRAALIVSGEQACEKEITVLLDGTLP